jgi:hypothetical protein
MMSLVLGQKKSTSEERVALHAMSPPSDATILRQTIRTTLAMVSACVLFVGLLSILAVVVVARAVGAPTSEAAPVESPSTSQPGHAKSGEPGTPAAHAPSRSAHSI